LLVFFKRQAENKRKFESTSRNNQNQQQQQNKRQNIGQAYTAGNSDRKSYASTGHIARDCRGTGNANNTLTTRRAPDRVRNLLVLNAEFRDTTERNVQG
ncbi:hypothetical protein Tco_0338925, partial [Tanacetum coccineum]